jgi:hypothetical protein
MNVLNDMSRKEAIKKREQPLNASAIELQIVLFATTKLHINYVIALFLFQ